MIAPPFNRKTCALLMIDFQRDFCEVGGYADQLGGVDWAQEAMTAAARLLATARDAGLMIVHTREGYAPDLSDCTLQRQIRSAASGAAIGANGPLGRFLIRGEPGQDLVESLQADAAELVLDKPSYGAFATTDLEARLRAAGIDHLLVAGVTADVCVHTTVREATDRGFFVHYVEDAISTFDPELRSACARMIDVEGGIWGQRTTTKDLALRFSEALRPGGEGQEGFHSNS